MGDRVDQPGGLAHRRGRDAQMGKRVPGVGIAAVLTHDEIGSKDLGQRWQREADRSQPGRIVGQRLKGQVDHRTRRGTVPDVRGGTRARKQRPAGLVHGNRQDVRVVAMDRFDAIAMMRVEVDIHDPQAGPTGRRNGQGHVVVDAESGGAARHGVMETAAGVERVRNIATEDGLEGTQRAAGHGRRGLVHTRERRHVARADAHRRWLARIRGEPSDGRHVGGLVDRQEILVAGRLRGQAWLRAERFEQVDPRAEPARSERMVRPEVVFERTGAEDEQRLILCAHTWHHGAMERVYTTPLIDKLGIRPGARVAIVGVDDPEFRTRLAERTHDVSVGEPQSQTDVIVLAADSADELAQIGPLRERIVPNGAIWVVSRKGKTATLRDVEVIAAARAVDLVDNKVVSFSATHTALRLVIPVSLRTR